MTGSKPLTPRGERTRAALVAAARVIFERDGFAESRLIDITGQANCAAGSFYTYFTSKEEILRAVLVDAREDMLHPGEPHVEVDDDDPTEVIAAANRAYFEAYARNAQLMVVLDQVAATDAAFRQLRRERTELFVRRNAKRIKDLQARGLADPELNPQMAASALSAMVSRMAYHYFTLEDADLWSGVGGEGGGSSVPDVGGEGSSSVPGVGGGSSGADAEPEVRGEASVSGSGVGDDWGGSSVADAAADGHPGLDALVFTATRLWVNAIGLRQWRQV